MLVCRDGLLLCFAFLFEHGTLLAACVLHLSAIPSSSLEMPDKTSLLAPAEDCRVHAPTKACF